MPQAWSSDQVTLQQLHIAAPPLDAF